MLGRGAAERVTSTRLDTIPVDCAQGRINTGKPRNVAIYFDSGQATIWARRNLDGVVRLIDAFKNRTSRQRNSCILLFFCAGSDNKRPKIGACFLVVGVVATIAERVFLALPAPTDGSLLSCGQIIHLLHRELVVGIERSGTHTGGRGA